MYKKLIRLYINRKQKLKGILDDNSVELRPEKTQQIQGAIDEIEFFLLTLQQYQDKAIQRNFGRQLVSQPSKKGIFTRVSRIFKSSRIQKESDDRKLEIPELPIDGVPI